MKMTFFPRGEKRFLVIPFTALLLICATGGPNNPSDNDEIALGTEGWNNKSDIYGSDNRYAEVGVEDGESSRYLVARDFGFAIPAGSVIDGIEVTIERKGQDNKIEDRSVRLLKSGALAGNDYAVSGHWPDADGVRTYGGPSDIWGTAWTPAEINASGFGVAIAIQKKSNGGGEKTAFIDHIQVKIIYTSPLPIELTSFSARMENRQVVVKWATASETNNDFFTIERSTNGATFSELAKVKGAGNSTTTREYSYTDGAPASGTSYYRLKQTDFDGKSEYFSIIAVENSQEKGSCTFQVFPNPCMGKCSVKLEDCPQGKDKTITVAVIDMLGNLVYSQVPVRDDAGSFDFSIDVNNNLKPGVYIVRASSENEKYEQKVIVNGN
ncbi:MAG: T9SS type A sorting domain-containing protein [Bacteroidota bacterium]